MEQFLFLKQRVTAKMVLQVKEWYDYDGKLNLTIEWDENNPLERQFNDWTAADFLTAIKNACDKELSMGDTIRSDNC